jgi:small subunit ribosomal protein S6
MPLYETIFITRQEVSSHDLEKITLNFTKTLTDLGGSVVKTEQWGLRDLAYPIKKSNKAYYTLLGIDSPYTAVKELERKLSLSEDILRYMTIKVEEISKNPSPPIAKHSSSDEETEVSNSQNDESKE